MKLAIIGHRTCYPMDFEKLDVAMEDAKVVLEDGLLKPLPPEAEAELDRVLDKEDID